MVSVTKISSTARAGKDNISDNRETMNLDDITKRIEENPNDQNGQNHPRPAR